MAVDIRFNLDLNNDPNNDKTVGQLREEFRKLEEQVDNTKQGTEEYNQAVKQLGQVSGELEKVDRAIEAMNPERKAQVIGDAVAGMSGGFQAAVASAELFGVENEAVLESLQRVNAVMAITEGITAFSEKIPAMKTLIATMPRLQRALKGARVGFQGLSTATKALGIGLLVSAIALLVTHWDDLESIITDLIPGLEDTGELFGKITDGAIAVGKAILQYLATPMKAIIQLMSGDFQAAKDTVVEGFNVIGNTAEEFDKRQAERGLQTTIENLEKKLELEQAYGNDTTEIEQEIFEKKKLLYDEDSEQYKELLREKQLADANAERQRREREEREQQERLERQRTYEQQIKEARESATDTPDDSAIEPDELDLSIDDEEEGEEMIFANGKFLPRSIFKAMVDTGQIAKLEAIDAELALAEKGSAEYIRLEKQRADAATAIAEAESDAKIATFEKTGQALGQLARLAGEQTVIGKALGVAQATIDTYVGANKALAQGGIFGFVSAAAVIASGLANVKQIVSTKVPSIQGQPLGTPAQSPGGATAMSTALPRGLSANPPSFNDSGVNTVNTVASDRDREAQNRTVKAVVVETDITETQNRVDEIESQARF